ncbi:hypothetical protein [Metabacillus halosaccharovorans]|uniref:hypothetical protein n=1 Tax=Metabacillus halosaccharovorans TaxID=930124 RepID=UPI001C1FFD8B|nr:hypothetical protein [Metabacillus halosaccharovorans]MBU7591110.1 hypothetical protein [Metabacillus halosaccharovorans]
MLGNWNTVIKTAYYQIYSIFTIKEDDSGGCSLRMETEPFEMNLSFNRVQIEGQTLKAFCIDPKGQFKDIELTFDGDTFSGVLTSSFMGKLSFSGKRGQGESLNDKLRYYGEKSLQENRYWKGKWIWDVNQPEANENLEHKLVFFRRTFNVPKGITPVLKVEITADSRYRLFINGHSVSVGPCKGDQHVQYYETVDVSRFLVPGKNVLAVKVLRYPSLEPFKIGEGGPISVWRSQSAGLFVEASLRDENNIELEPLHSGSEWKAFRHKGYSHVAKPLIQWMGGLKK